MKLQRFLEDDSGPKSLQERYGRNIYAVRIDAVEGGSRRQEL